MLEKKSTEQEKMWIMQMVQADIAQGFLDTSDAVQVIYTHNAKQSVSILAYRVKKAKEKMQANEMAKIKLNNDGSKEAAIVAAGLTKEQKQMEFAHIQAMAKIEADKEVMLLDKKLQSQERVALHQDQTKIIVSQDTAQGKIVSTDIAGQHQQVKQQIANAKPEKETASV